MFKKLVVIVGWMLSAFLTLGVTTTTLRLLTKPVQQDLALSYNNNQSGTVLGFNITDSSTGMTTSIKKGDARPTIIRQYLERYHSPMAPYSQYIVDEAVRVADKYDLNSTHLAFLTVAIAQNESNLGKKMPENCHNAWGWGITATTTTCFESWEEGISTHLEGIGGKYMNEWGLKTPEEIMRRYTPASPQGAWAKNVSQFLEQLETANF